ncbi:hypothetical protein F2P81_009682 [Scophthalmus maximus]|uniref:STAS domain-containing protein n=1 Tax=Scophthalmus maximus TaxID=52904 RepID=A0A6A4T4C8_SCOMX|nr:hypothetical protein F2P81_009682 [Scophthalmus maximus]
MEQEAAREDADSQPTYRIERPVYSEALIRSKLLSRKENSITLRERLANHFRCSSARARAAVLSFLPILTWLPSYPVRRFLFSDVVSGLSTGVVQLPQGLAYAMLAAVPPVYGLYSSFYPVLLYTFFGTSRHISVGTFAVMSLMIGGVAVREAPDDMFNVLPANASNMSATVDTEARDARRVQVAVMLTTLILFGVLRFGFVTIYLTEPLVRGFTTAASLHVFVSQLKYLLGVKTQRFCGVLSIVYSLKAVLWNITSTNVATLILGLVGIVFLYLVKYVNERFKKKLPVPIPGEIIVVMVSTGVSYGLSLSDDYMVDVVGKIPTGLLPPAAPDFSLFPRLITDSFTVAIVGFSMDISLAKTFALKHGYSVDGNQAIWLVACAASVLLGLDYGLLVAVFPKSSVLGHVPGTGLYYDVDEYEEAAEYEGIKIFHSNSSIYFANSDLYVTSLKEKTGVNPEHIQAARKARKKQEAKANDNHSSPPQICVKYGKQEVTREVSSDNHVAVQHINGPVGDSCPDVDSEVVHLKTPNAVHSIVLDWTPVTFIDSVGAKAIKQVSKEYAAVGVRVVIAACSRSLLAELDTLQFFTGVMTPDVMFPTVHDAVLHCHHSGSCPVAVAAVAAPPPVEELS